MNAVISQGRFGRTMPWRVPGTLGGGGVDFANASLRRNFSYKKGAGGEWTGIFSPGLWTVFSW